MAIVLLLAARVHAANIGVLDDGRQEAQLSLMDQNSAAAAALLAHGHTITPLPVGALISPATLDSVDVVWLPLLADGQIYSQSERSTVEQFVTDGGSVVWIGDAFVSGEPDDSFLSEFGLGMLFGSSGIGLTPSNPDHPVVTGPHGMVNLIGSNAGYGLFSSSDEVADVFMADPGPGTLVGFMDANSGFAGTGRVAFICDATMFSQLLEQDGHQALLLNVVTWAADAPGYTPAGIQIGAGPLANGCDACTNVTLTFSEVDVTGETTVGQIGSGRCSFAGVSPAAIPDDFIGFGLEIQTSAIVGPASTLQFDCAYDAVALANAGIPDAAALRLYDVSSGSAIEITLTVDQPSELVMSNPIPAQGTVQLLFGAIIVAEDCDGSGTPDVCDVIVEGTDCNGNGVPDTCDLEDGTSADCNDNATPDECDVQAAIAESSAMLSPIGAGAPVSFTVFGALQAVDDVVVEISAVADLSVPLEYIDVELNGTNVGRVFESDASDCPIDPDLEQLIILRDTFNNLVTPGGDAVFELVASSAVNATLCNSSFAQIEVRYGGAGTSEDCDLDLVPDECESTADCNANGIRDICEVAQVGDCNGNGIPDDCDVGTEGSADCNANDVPDECESTVAIAGSVDPVASGTVVLSPGNEGSYLLCSMIDVEAIPSVGYCFSTWSVSGGSEVSDPGNPVTSVAADQAKTVTAHFVAMIAGHPESVQACEGESVTFSVTPHADIVTGSTYQWRRDGVNLDDGGAISGATTANLTIDPISGSEVGTFTCVVTNGCGSAESEGASLSMIDATRIDAQATNVAACPGDEVQFEIQASGDTLQYQWQQFVQDAFVDLADGAGTAGATSALLQLADVDADDAGTYRCRVTGTCGVPVFAEDVLLSVGAGPSIVSPPSALAVCLGDTAVFTVQGAGTNLTYAWRYNDGSGAVELADDENVSGSGTAQLSIANVDAARAGDYTCVLSGDCPVAIETPAAALTVKADTAVLVAPQDASSCPGGTVQLTVVALGSELTYQWQYSDGGAYLDITESADKVGTTTATLTLSNLTEAEAGNYRCVVNGDCGPSRASDPALLTVHEQVSVIGNPVSLESCGGGVAGFEVSASGTGLTYQWQFNGGAAYQNLVDDGVISGATTASLQILGATGDHAGVYRCVVGGTCLPTATSDIATLTIGTGVCDCNENGTPDADDVDSADSADCNANDIPDECEIAAGSAAPGGPFFCTVGCVSDCNDNGMPDDCDLADGLAEDCNGNGVPDSCDIAGGTELDCNNNGLPDSCDLQNNDCDGNGRPDECDVPYVADAGDDFDICTLQISSPLGGETVASGSNPGYAYAWRILSGPDGGAELTGDAAERAQIRATVPGTYEIELEVTDSSVPPCVVTDRVLVNVYDLVVDAGNDVSMCADDADVLLDASVSGGVGPFEYTWTVESGSPSTDASQFTGSGSASLNPTFAPAIPGTYTLRLTVRDANAQSCLRSDTVTIIAHRLTVSVPEAFALCAAAESENLLASVTSGTVPPYTYAWSIDSGSASTDLSQFGGNGIASSAPTFTPSLAGLYKLRITVTDSNNPPCIVSKTIDVTAGSLFADAGSEATRCVGGAAVQLFPEVTGGVPPLTHAWSIESGSPSTAPTQFLVRDPSNPAWVFQPEAIGAYTLKLTVMDSGSPPCVRTDTVVIRSTTMTVDAGEDFMTQALQPSRPLGALPLVAGGGPDVRVRWDVLAGPVKDESQFSDVTQKRPRFTPAAVGTYSLRVTVTDETAGTCSVSDTVVVTAITAEVTLPVNAEGRLFMSLSLEAPHTAAEARLALAEPGVEINGLLYDDGADANFTGLVPIPTLARRLYLTGELQIAEFVAVIAMRYNPTEAEGVDEETLRLHWWNGAAWTPAGSRSPEEGPFPSRPTTSDVGRQGVDRIGDDRVMWVVVDMLGEYSIGVSSGIAPATPPAIDPGVAAPMCGAFGSVIQVPLMLACMVGLRRRKTCASST